MTHDYSAALAVSALCAAVAFTLIRVTACNEVRIRGASQVMTTCIHAGRPTKECKDLIAEMPK